MPRKKTETKTPVETIKHKDKRKNIPTTELRDFVQKDERQPAKVKYPGLLYARDPSLDPQLVWKGKDALDSEELTVPSVPIYIQEKVHPQAIIEDVRQAAMEGKPRQVDLFADFNGIKFEDLIEFYRHEANWANRMILGDSLLVMTSLAEKEGLKGKVQMVYIDPPYGIKFASNWQVSTRKRDVKDGKLEDATRQPEQIRAFRDTWELGIHSYLSYWRDRLVVARELLTESGSVFVQIGDENVHLVRCLLDEVFGSENFVGLITFRKKNMPFGARYIEGMVDYLLWYGKDSEHTKFKTLYRQKDVQGASRWNFVELPDGTTRTMTSDEWQNHSLLPAGSRVYTHASLRPSGYSEKQVFDVQFQGKTYHPPTGGCWTTTPTGLGRLIAAGRIGVENDNLRYRLFLDDYPVEQLHNFWTDTSGAGEKVYVVQTMDKVVERCLLMSTDPGDLVLDPTCGSGTSAYVAEQWGRRWITVDTSRVALALARTRLMAARFPYYNLADHKDSDVRKGFVYRTAPHITLGSIANNPDIKEGMSRADIDAAIARHADTEVLYDQPEVDNKRIRVTGPFTVESLSPHRVIAPDEERTVGFQEKKRLAEDGADGWSVKMLGAGQFGNIIIDNLRTAGVQNYIKNERLKFDRLDVHPGVWIHATGEFTEKGGATKRVAVCVGPEHRTVGAELVKEAAKEAVQGVGFDVLLVCGFAFDPSVSEETKRYGPLTVLPTKIHPDLQIDSEHLKKTGSAQLFTVFGEPDLKVKKVKDGKLTVEIKGLDVYDPTTGEIRSNSTDDIACWFIDTDYNGESFFVRHAYFTGGNEPYDKLKRALRAEIDETAWSALYSTVSRPFDPPKTGKIAVKVINHYGDEVLKVYDLAGKDAG